MVRIASSDQPFRLFIPGLDHLPPVSLPDYWIDTHEVTNRDFKRFVDDGGYRRAELWREPFVKDGRPIAFAEAMALFLVDSHGTAGARHVGTGRYPAGQDDYPVGGRQLVRSRGVCALGRQVTADDLPLEPRRRSAAERRRRAWRATSAARRCSRSDERAVSRAAARRGWPAT